MNENQKKKALVLYTEGHLSYREIGLRLSVTAAHAKKLVRAAKLAR